MLLTTSKACLAIAVKLCLMWQRPSTTGLAAAVSRFDDLIKSHQIQTFLVHGDGWFLPFHRLLMTAHETLLREECGYTGAQPYWDEASDAGSFTSSVIFDSVNGFGGDGEGLLGCIDSGPFANYTLHNGPGFLNVNHCITRDISDRNSLGSTQTNIDACLAETTYADAWPCMEAQPHAGGHSGVGGEMVNPTSSPGDPLFYLHHSFLDRVWWTWQEANLPARLTEIAGFTTQFRPLTGWVNATLDNELNMFGIVPNATIRDVMDTRSAPLCFEYVDPE